MAKITELKTQLAQMVNDAKALSASMEADVALQTTDNRTKFDNYLVKGRELRQQIEGMETLSELDGLVNEPAGEAKAFAGGRGGRGGAERKTLGEYVTTAEQMKTANLSQGVLAPVMVKGPFVETLAFKALYGSTALTGGALIRPDRDLEIVELAKRPASLLSLITRGRTAQSSVEYMRIKTRTNAGAIVPDWDAAQTADPILGTKFGTKPQSNLETELKTAAVKTIATWIAAAKTILMDVPNLQTMIDTELMYMIEFVLETQIVTGDGTGQNFTGILNDPDIATRTHKVSGRNFSANDTVLDTLRKAITDVALNFYMADGVALNPAEAERMELVKDSQGRYINIYDPVQNRVWRKPVIEANVLPAGKGIVAEFRMLAKIWDRMQAEISLGQPGYFFVQNAVALLCELRAAFAVQRPLAGEIVLALNT